MEDRLRKFATLVEAGNFTRASAVLHISQPALTVAIGKLERELGASLLTRGPRLFQLTPAGELAYRSAKELMVATSNLKTQLGDLAGQQASLTIGLIDSLASMLFAHQNSDAVTDEPGVSVLNLAQLSVIVNNSGYLLRAVSHDEIDLAFITEQSVATSPLLSVEPVGSEPMVLVCRADKKTEVEQALNHRLPQKFISYDRASTTHHLIDMALQAQKIAIETIFYSSSPEIMRELVLRGMGVSVLPYFLVKDQLASGQLRAVHHPGPLLVDRPISCVMRHGKGLPITLAGLPLQFESLLDAQARAVARL